jgi:ankyrin repeat protein
MNINVFYNKYNALKFLNEKISRKPIDSAEAGNLISKIENHLKDFGLNSDLVFSKLTIELKEKTIKLLSSLDKNLDLFEHTNAIDNLRKNICDFKSSLNNLEIQTEKKVLHPKIELKLSVFCDIGYAKDWNGAITGGVKAAFKEELPFVATRSLLQGSGLDQSEVAVFSKQLEIQKAALENESRWDIYQLCTPNNGNEFILFLPKSLLSDKTGEEKLKALDFNTDGLLKKVAAIDLFNESADKNDPEAFLHIFSQNPTIHKIFHFHGHGSSNYVAGIPVGIYKNIVHSLDRQKCKGIMICSCYAGGESSLHSLSTGVNSALKYSIDSSPLSYPIIVGSIGDFPTYGSTSRVKDLLEGFQDFIQKNSQNPEKAKKFLQGSGISTADYSKIYFPSTQSIPGVFKPICEDGNGYSLTPLEIKKSKLEIRKSKVELKDAQTGITIKHKQFLYISPMINDVPITFADTDPVLVSMIPGDGHHFLQSLQINSDNPQDFLNKTIDWHKKSELNVNKAFFIKTLKGKTSCFDDVVLSMDSIGGFFAYRLGDLYFCCDKNGIKPITAIQHAIIVKSAVIQASPTSDAVDTTSQGYENEAIFKSVLNSELFQKTSNPNLRDFISILDSSQSTEAEIIKFAKDKLSRTEIEDFTLLLLLIDPQRELTQQLIKEEKISPNIKNAWGHTLLYFLNLSKFPAHRELINQEIDCNQLNRGESPLHMAISHGDIELLKAMLKQPGVDVNLKDSKGCPPIFYAVRNQGKAFNLLKEAGASLKEISNDGLTVLNKAILTKQWDLCEELLTIHKVDPNLGKPSPLNLAIEQNAEDLIAKLIKAGAKPFTEDSKGIIPFIQAILSGKVEVVKSLVQEKECSFNIEDINGLSPTVAALWSENLEIIKALYEKGANFDTLPGRNDHSILSFLAQKLERKGGDDFFGELLKIFNKNPETCSKLLQKAFNENDIPMVRFFLKLGIKVTKFSTLFDPEVLANLIQENLIDPKQKPPTGQSIFYEIGKQALADDKYLKAFHSCLTKEVEVNEKDLFGNTLLGHALIRQNFSMAKLLMKSGFKVSDCLFPSAIVQAILTSKDLDLIRLIVVKDQIDLMQLFSDSCFTFYELCEVLIAAESDAHLFQKHLKEKNIDLNKNPNIGSLLYSVVRDKNLALIKFLLKLGIKIPTYSIKEIKEWMDDELRDLLVSSETEKK